MAKIYTKTGDNGDTCRFDGTRVPKHDPVIEANGIIDECNSLIGAARSFNEDGRLDSILRELQNQLIVAGSEVTNVGKDRRLPFITRNHIESMEALIDELEQGLPRLTHFILPAGGKVSAQLHLARTSSRKVERRLAALEETTAVNEVLSSYFNRLSDLLFVLARHAARSSGGGEEIWLNSSTEN